MEQQKLFRNDRGFALLPVAIIVTVAVLGFVGGTVYIAQKRNNNANKNNAATEQIEEKKTEDTDKTEASEAEKVVEEPAPEPKPAPAPAPKTTTTTEKKKTEPTYTAITISNLSHSIGADNVTISGNLPAAYSGTCYAWGKNSDGTKDFWYEQSISNSGTCSVNVPRSKLTSGTWSYYLKFKNSDYVKGQAGPQEFSIP